MKIEMARVYETMVYANLTLVDDMLYSDWDSPNDHKRVVSIDDELDYIEDKFIVKYLNKDKVKAITINKNEYKSDVFI